MRRPTLEHRVDLRRRLPARRPEHDPEQKDGEQEVGRRAGPDRDHPAPRGLTPVGIRAQTVAQLLKATRQRACLDPTVCRNRLDRLELTASLVEVLGIERPLQPLGRADQLRGLANGASEVRVDIGRLWTRHAGNGHVAAERDDADRVVDVVPAHLGDRRAEPDREPARTHANGDRTEEVAALVNEDQEGEAEDRDRNAHAFASAPSAIARASASTSVRSSRSAAA